MATELTAHECREIAKKHFTDAELAAEVWLSHTGFWYGNGKKARLQREILTRFATLPHFSDAD